ncbi:MAG: hypothetical protein K2O13_03825, partial [Lachnospiraceae bacterium]|nr:hypothetical protein [Lachnospiraceae bacterium]
MIYIYSGIICAYLIFWMLSWREEGKGPFQRMALYILRKEQSGQHKKGHRRNWQRDMHQRQLGDKLKTLQPEVAVQIQVRNYYMSQYSILLKVVFLGTMLCLGVWIAARSSPLLMEGGYLQRNSYGEGDVSVALSARTEGNEEEIFAYVVEERKYTDEEAEELYGQAIRKLPEIICGQNGSLEDVRTHLDLVTKMEGYPFAISWESDSYSIVNTDGTVNNEELEEGAVVALTAHFQYEKEAWDYQMYVRVNPIAYTKQEQLRRRIEELLHLQEERTGSTEMMILPESVGSVPIVWKEITEDGSGYLLLLVLTAALLLYWTKGREPDRKLETRRKELLLDYPEIVNKLALY